ncbi:MAG: hypothetical protein N2044_01155 [Cyclobacteriaceae bacterium]|nr:hypothetical protein [Cyclobacteriaceae bacterium]MCX7636430.1 hypothetical protein [Cyclobacteriaceae bacterium]MDW8330749.1 hypothetical protein [Cyclobacteriaceae bacterium]
MFRRDLELERSWQNLLTRLESVIGKRPSDLNAVLFLIGLQELGQGSRPFTKEEKQDLMHIATCRVLSLAGYYKLEGLDQDGWPHWVPVKKLPRLSLNEQEKLLKMQIIEYFEQEYQWTLKPDIPPDI